MNMIKCANLQFYRKSNQHCPNHYFTIIFIPGEKPLIAQSREPTNLMHIWQRLCELNPRHIGGRQVLSRLCQPCHWLSKCIYLPVQLKLYHVQTILYQFKLFCPSSKTNCSKVKIELQHIRNCMWLLLLKLVPPDPSMRISGYKPLHPWIGFLKSL